MLRSSRPKYLRSSTFTAPLVRSCRVQTRPLLTLAIETSCDDTSVAVLEKHDGVVPDDRPRAVLHFHDKVTSDNRQFKGVSPIQALESHQENLASLVQRAATSYATQHGKRLEPDFISVTRGPGMRTSVSTGIDTAKGLAVAYGVPLVGVNHMQAHALTPRLVSALNSNGNVPEPAFPFLSLLVSGGHTMLLSSESLTSHKILASTTDIAVGDALDKIAREILPEHVLQSCKDVSYARDLEAFVIPPGTAPEYVAPATREQEIKRRQTQWGWSLPVPLAEIRGGQKSNSMELSFSGLDSAVRRTVAERKAQGEISDEERKVMGYEAMRIAFEHIASRTVFGLDMFKEQDKYSKQSTDKQRSIDTVVVSGGVAANRLLRVVFSKYLAAKGYPNVKTNFPPMQFCTDNAAMIAWAGMEMYEAGWESELKIRPLRKWSLDPDAADGGILGVGGWRQFIAS